MPCFGSTLQSTLLDRGCDDLNVGQPQARPGVLDPNRGHLKKGKFTPAKDSLVRLFR
jgi:hypothetical protein